MADKYTNPDPNTHVDLLRQQVKTFSLVKHRMVREGRTSEAGKLNQELIELNNLIIEKTYKKS